MANDINVYGTQEVADMLGLHNRTVLRMIERGELSAKKLGNKYLISRDSVQAFLTDTTPQNQREVSDIARTLNACPELTLLMKEAADLPDDQRPQIVGELVTTLRRLKKRHE